MLLTSGMFVCLGVRLCGCVCRLVDFNAVEGLVRELTESVTKRRQVPVGTVQHALLSNKLRTAIPQVRQS